MLAQMLLFGLLLATPATVSHPGPSEAHAGSLGSSSGGAVSSCRPLPPGQRLVRLNLKPDAGIMDLIDWISSITCDQFLIGVSAVPTAGKKVTIVSPELITVEEANRLFLAALDSVGLTVERTGQFFRVLDATKARFVPLPILKNGDPTPPTRRFVTRLVRLRYLDALDFTNKVLNRLKSAAGDIVAYHSALIITDLSESVDRLVRMVDEFDAPLGSQEHIWLVRVKHMSVLDMASRIAEIGNVLYLGTGQRNLAARRTSPKPAPGPAGDLQTELTVSKLIPDLRTNSLIVVASQRAHDRVLSLVHQLDVPLADQGRGSDERFHIYDCENANCNELAATLSATTGVQVVGSLSAIGKRSRAPVATAVRPGIAPPQFFESDIRVAFDAPTNSLLVMSNPRDYQRVLRVIEVLDAPRKQVFIEATIMEVLVDKSRQVGVSYHAGVGETVGGQNGLALGGFNASQTMNPTALVNNLGGLSAALFGPTTGDLGNSTLFKGLPINIPSFGVFLQLLQTNNDVNILSTPDILIMNNESGEMSVGEVLPFPSATTAGLGSAAGADYLPFTSVQRQPVELKLKLAPSVNESDVVRLDVDQEISDVTSPNYNGMGPATSKRSVKTTVIVPDQQTVVIGGLMADRVSETVQKIPILGDIPVIGFFFRSTTKALKKSNIVIALTPYVVSDLSDLRRVAERKLRERRAFMDRYSSLEDTSNLARQEIDYRRKRGMLEEINRDVGAMEEDEAALRKLRQRELKAESQPMEVTD